MTPTRPSRDRSDCRNLESGGQRALRLTGANHSELKETCLQDVPVKESRADISSSLKTRPAVLMSFFSACNKDPMKEKIRSFWPTCTVLLEEMEETQPHRPCWQSDVFFACICSLFEHSFIWPMAHIFVNLSTRFFRLRIQQEWSYSEVWDTYV